MNKRKRFQGTDERKIAVVYALLFYFTTSFLAKTGFGFFARSNALMVSGVFALFGVFISIVAFLRIYTAAGRSPGKVAQFNAEKIEFVVALGISTLIALSAGTLLFFIAHIAFSHVLYPPAMLAAWVAVAVAVANWCVLVRYKDAVEAMKEAEGERLVFILQKDFILSMVLAGSVVVSRIGYPAVDYVLALFEVLFILAYAAHFLYQSYQGLMDASCDSRTVSEVSQIIRRSDPGIKIRDLKVNRIGVQLEVIASLKADPQMSIRKAKSLAARIRASFRERFERGVEAHIGFES